MSHKGFIEKLNFKSRSGYIRYGELPLLYFDFLDIINLNKRRIKEGLGVYFEIAEDNFKIKHAAYIYVYYPKRIVPKVKVTDPILFPTNWEENETHYLPNKYNTNEMQSNSSNNKPANPILQPQDFVALALFDRKIRLVSLNKDGEFRFLDKANIAHNIFYPSVFEEIALQIAIEEFEELLNSSKSSELDFQKFFEKHPEFILNDEYKKAHSHIVLTNVDDEKLIPDFILEPVNQNSFCDLLELKLHTPEVFVMKKNRERYSSAVAEAAAQLREYARFFDSEINRTNFNTSYPHLKIYKPRMFVIIGRENSSSAYIKRQIQSDNPELLLKTYDEIMARMKWKKNNLTQKNAFFR